VRETFSHTWDGLPVSDEKPYGASVVVWRRRGGRREWLILHRHHLGPAYEGDWAWTPPSGARLPGESVAACASREVAEETGLVALELQSTDCGSDEWAVFAAEAAPDGEVRLDAEHDRYRWVRLEEACNRCLPRVVGDGLRRVDAWLDERRA